MKYNFLFFMEYFYKICSLVRKLKISKTEALEKQEGCEKETTNRSRW
uniref:Uncharacterized protein n=1 Tax=Rhizophora mucronata TaxID=61149 RepID=A0A2P2QTQ0_RHIMU